MSLTQKKIEKMEYYADEISNFLIRKNITPEELGSLINYWNRAFYDRDVFNLLENEIRKIQSRLTPYII